MVVPVHDFLNEIIIHEDAAFGVHFPIHPYLNPPLVAVKPVALPLIVEKPVTGLEKYLLVDAGFHSYSICIHRLIIIGETEPEACRAQATHTRVSSRNAAVKTGENTQGRAVWECAGEHTARLTGRSRKNGRGYPGRREGHKHPVRST